MRSIHIRATEFATSVFRASEFPWTLAFCMLMTAAAPMAITVIAMSTSIAV
jgi:hypothetical protein